MVPTLIGRFQTRIFVLAVVGSLWTLIITLVLPGRGELSAAYGVTFRILATVAVLGVPWELVYHGLQQFRWEKDWPTLFGLLTAVNEGLLIWVLLGLNVVPGVHDVRASTFLVDFVTVWLVTWVWVNGPMRIPAIRWRFQGGRVV